MDDAVTETSIPIHVFEARDYESQVLSLEPDQTEQELDQEYIQDAQDAGIEMLASPSPAKDSSSSWLSTNTLSTGPPRRSHSSDSHGSCSTGVTSTFSQTSPDPYYTTHPYHLRFRSLSSSSLVEADVDEHVLHSSLDDAMLSTVITAVMAPSNAHPTTSLVLPHQAESHKAFSMRRGLGRLSKLGKPNTLAPEAKDNLCLRCSSTGGPHLGPLVSFTCGHKVCRPHLRQLVAESLRLGDCRPPQCCGRSIPRLAVQTVTREDEVERLFPSPPRPPPPRMSSIPRLPVDIKLYPSERGRPRRFGSTEEYTFQRPISDEAQRNLRCAMACSNFKALRHMQEDQRDRFLKFRRAQREELAIYHGHLRRTKEDEHAKEVREAQNAHQRALSTLEDKHVATEIDLHEAHKQETKNCLLKLRHMEAYCNGTSTSTPTTPNTSSADLLHIANTLQAVSPFALANQTSPITPPASPTTTSFPNTAPAPTPASPPTLHIPELTSAPCSPTPSPRHGTLSSPASVTSLRTITTSDRRALTRQYWERDHLAARHTSAINVLREQQARQLRQLAARQVSDLHDLERAHADALEATDRVAAAEAAELDTLFEGRKERLSRRWELGVEIWKRRRAREGVLCLPFPVLGVGWPVESGGGSAGVGSGAPVAVAVPAAGSGVDGRAAQGHRGAAAAVVVPAAGAVVSCSA